MITHSQSLFGDPYPRQYQKELQPCNSFNPSRPLNPTTPALDSSPNNKNTILPLKLFQHPRVFIQPFPKTIQIPLSLSLSLPQVSVSQFSTIDDASTLANRPPSSAANGPHLVGKLQAFRYSLVLSLSLAASLLKETYRHTMYTHIIEFLMCYLLGFVSKT
jgi:hypothetical protein